MTTVRLGLISDTHQPQRMTRLPEKWPQSFADVQLILHAGSEKMTIDPEDFLGVLRQSPLPPGVTAQLERGISA